MLFNQVNRYDSLVERCIVALHDVVSLVRYYDANRAAPVTLPVLVSPLIDLYLCFLNRPKSKLYSKMTQAK